MHLKFDPQGKAKPDVWVVIDDFGAKHDALHKGMFGGFSDSPARRRSDFLYSEDHDPDFNRAPWNQPKTYTAREATAFASPIGMSIEAEICIDFELIPAWNEDRFEPMWTQAEGAQIRITRAGINEWEWSPASTSIAQKALEAFCWAYVEMERAREDASARQAMETEQ